MKDHYHIDLEKYCLYRFKENLESREMIPSRMSLKDELDERFRVLKNQGIQNLKHLIDALKTKPRIIRFSKETGLSIEYLTLLKREAKSYLPNPIRLDKFPGIPKKYAERLISEGIINSRHMFNLAQDKEQRKRLSLSTGIPIEVVDKLFCLSDLARVYGVGPVFAQMIYDVGIKSINDFITYSAEDFIRIYEAANQKKADFGVNEIQFSLDLANELDLAAKI